MLIAAQALRLSRVRGGSPSYLMRGLASQSILAFQATPRVEKEKHAH